MAAVGQGQSTPQHSTPPFLNTGCMVCRSSAREQDILLCDSCGHEYHRQCLRPPLAMTPPGEWLCRDCAYAKMWGLQYVAETPIAKK